VGSSRDIRRKKVVFMKKKPETAPKRQYPPVYGKLVPVMLGILGIAIIIVLFIIFGIALGLFPG
jgi:hypothetical protein